MAAKFDTRNIMQRAWASYRRVARDMHEAKFNRSRFNYELRLAWAQARTEQPKPLPPAARVIVLDPIREARAVAIRAELEDMQYGDFIPWQRHGELRAELARLAA